MNKFRLILCALAVAVITAGFLFHEVKPLAEDIPYLDVISGETL